MTGEAILVGGLGFGDEGKGSIVDYLVRTQGAKLVVRYNGGAQAGHNVVTPEGLHHTFSQFGSGTFVPGVKTHLSRFMILNPLGMVREEEHLRSLGIKDVFQRTTIDELALVTTPFQIAVNRLLETWRGDKKHGSCGIGIGQTIEDYEKYGDKVLFAKDLKNPAIMSKKLEFIQKQCLQAVRSITSNLSNTETVKTELEWLECKNAVDYLVKEFSQFSACARIVGEKYLTKLLEDSSPVIFEGAQGALLDRNCGFKPHITKTDTTLANAYVLLREAGYKGKITKIGVLRAYATRHGAGPLPTEDEKLTKMLNDDHNVYNQWQDNFRVGWLDIPLTKYAIMINDGVDFIALTNLDRLSILGTIKVRINSGFIEFSAWQELVDFLQNKNGLNCPIKILSFGPTWKEKKIN
ncbi:MAG: adenylosuccinate synthetase [Candidatus Nealsonbacteria bacterium]|nr:adenylosuccinate synthetase [Candidatus Nealsonbacteria bacterium]